MANQTGRSPRSSARWSTCNSRTPAGDPQCARDQEPGPPAGARSGAASRQVHGPHRRDGHTEGLVRGQEVEGHRRADHRAGRRRHAGTHHQRDRRAGRRSRSRAGDRATRDPPANPVLHRSVHRSAGSGDRHQGGRLARALCARRQDRPVRRRRRRQNRHHSGTDQQHRQGARRLFGVCRRGRAHA